MIFVILVGLTLSGAWFSYSSKNINPLKTEFLSASWSYGYGSITELAKESDLVALVQIEDKAQEWSLDQIPLTDYKATIIKPIVNAKEGENILLTITGVNNINKHVEIEDDPLFEKGEEFLIFAHKNDRGTYTILGGPQGRFKYINGELYSMKHVSERVNWGLIDIKGQTLNEIESKIVANLKTISEL